MKSYATEFALSQSTCRAYTVPVTDTRRDPREFWQIIRPCKDKLYNYILKALNFSEDGEDVYQETVLKAYKNLHGFRKKSSLRTWLFSIAINEIRQFHRKRKRDESKMKELFAGDTIDAMTTPADKILVENVYEIARSFNLKYRQVFFLFYYNRFSIEEIREITGIKSGSIKYILNICRETIKKELGGKDEFKISR